MTSTRSARNTASGIECVISSTVLPVSRWMRISSTFIRSRVMRVERAERLVHQHDLGIVHQRAADRGALLHAAGELPGQLLLEALEPDQLQQRLGARRDILSRGSRFMSIGSITLARMLRHGSSSAFWNTMPTLPCGFVTCSPSTRISPVDRRQQSRDHLQQRGLAAAGRADHDKELAVVDVEVERPQRRHVAVARPIGLRHAGELDAGAAPAARSDTRRRCAAG